MLTNRVDYLKVSFKHLASEHYEELEQDITMETAHMLHNVFIRMRNGNHINNKTLTYLDPYNYNIACPPMYFLPKIHKTPPIGEPFVGRPIVDAQVLRPESHNLWTISFSQSSMHNPHTSVIHRTFCRD